MDDAGRLVYHVRAELEPGEDRRTVRFTVPDDANQRGPFGTPMAVMVTVEPGTTQATPARVEVRPMYDLLVTCSIELRGPNRWGTVTVRNHSINTIAASLPGGSMLAEYDVPQSTYPSIIRVPDGGLYLAPGQAWSYEMSSMLAFASSEQTWSVRMRPRDDERSHANNDASCRVPHPPAPPPPPQELPDLIVSQVEVTPTSGPPSTEFVVTVRVENQGAADTGFTQVFAECSIPGPEERAEIPSRLAIGESDEVIFTVNSLPPGDKTTNLPGGLEP